MSVDGLPEPAVYHVRRVLPGMGKPLYCLSHGVDRKFSRQSGFGRKSLELVVSDG
jgi:hypothetical protein